MMINKVTLFCEHRLVTERVLGDGALEIGSSRAADFVLDEPSLPARAYLVQAARAPCGCST